MSEGLCQLADNRQLPDITKEEHTAIAAATLVTTASILDGTQDNATVVKRGGVVDLMT